MKKCPYCNEEIQDIAKKCRFCGEWLEYNTIENPKKINPIRKEALSPWAISANGNPRKTKKQRWKVLLPLGLAFWLLGNFLFVDVLAIGATFKTMGTVTFFMGIYSFVYRKKDGNQTSQA
jgi:TRAP-type uncharacterized transport system fused permease subunit